jgi:hypothetical protein
VVIQAVDDFQRGMTRDIYPHWNSARQFLFCDDENLWSICRLAGLDPRYVQEKARKLRPERRGSKWKRRRV